MSEEILIVDDNADIRNIINELIIDAGYKTRLAANYNQALKEIDKMALHLPNTTLEILHLSWPMKYLNQADLRQLVLAIMLLILGL